VCVTFNQLKEDAHELFRDRLGRLPKAPPPDLGWRKEKKKKEKKKKKRLNGAEHRCGVAE